MGTMVVSSVLLVSEKGVRKRALIKQVNKWLQNWCWQQTSVFYGHVTLSAEQCLLGRDG